MREGMKVSRWGKESQGPLERSEKWKWTHISPFIKSVLKLWNDGHIKDINEETPNPPLSHDDYFHFKMLTSLNFNTLSGMRHTHFFFPPMGNPQNVWNHDFFSNLWHKSPYLFPDLPAVCLRGQGWGRGLDWIPVSVGRAGAGDSGAAFRQLSATPWTVAHRAPLSMGFSRQEYWRGLPFPPPGDLPDPGIVPVSPVAPALAGRFFIPEPPWKPPLS